jgi:uncharacterized protein YajQ (UPF0234 family)
VLCCDEISTAVALGRSHNVKCRHLNKDQIMMFEAAAEAFLMPKRGVDRIHRPNATRALGRPTQKQIATNAGISASSLRKAAKVIKDANPSVTMAVREGKVSVE